MKRRETVLCLPARAAGIPMYGVSSLFVDPDNTGVHGLNEHIAAGASSTSDHSAIEAGTACAGRVAYSVTVDGRFVVAGLGVLLASSPSFGTTGGFTFTSGIVGGTAGAATSGCLAWGAVVFVRSTVLPRDGGTPLAARVRTTGAPICGVRAAGAGATGASTDFGVRTVGSGAMISCLSVVRTGWTDGTNTGAGAMASVCPRRCNGSTQTNPAIARTSASP